MANIKLPSIAKVGREPIQNADPASKKYVDDIDILLKQNKRPFLTGVVAPYTAATQAGNSISVPATNIRFFNQYDYTVPSVDITTAPATISYDASMGNNQVLFLYVNQDGTFGWQSLPVGLGDSFNKCVIGSFYIQANQIQANSWAAHPWRIDSSVNYREDSTTKRIGLVAYAGSSGAVNMSNGSLEFEGADGLGSNIVSIPSASSIPMTWHYPNRSATFQASWNNLLQRTGLVYVGTSALADKSTENAGKFVVMPVGITKSKQFVVIPPNDADVFATMETAINSISALQYANRGNIDIRTSFIGCYVVQVGATSLSDSTQFIFTGSVPTSLGFSIAASGSAVGDFMDKRGAGFANDLTTGERSVFRNKASAMAQNGSDAATSAAENIWKLGQRNSRSAVLFDSHLGPTNSNWILFAEVLMPAETSSCRVFFDISSNDYPAVLGKLFIGKGAAGGSAITNASLAIFNPANNSVFNLQVAYSYDGAVLSIYTKLLRMVMGNSYTQNISGGATAITYPMIDTGSVVQPAGTTLIIRNEVGRIFASPKSSEPGALLCNGATFDADFYAPLRQVLGTNILPDLRNRTIRGAGSMIALGAFQQNAAPNITGQVVNNRDHQYSPSFSDAIGAFSVTNSKTCRDSDGGSFVGYRTLVLNASQSNSAYGRNSATEVRVDSVGENYFICY